MGCSRQVSDIAWIADDAKHSDTPVDECPALGLCQLGLRLCIHIALPFKPVGRSVQDGPAVLLCIAGEDGLLPGLCAWTELWLKKVMQ